MFDVGLGAIAGSAISGILGYQGQRETNSSNETMANNATAANMAEAERNRSFQAGQSSAQMAYQAAETEKARKWEEQMSNTAMQRRAADMKAAGINPILGVEGASTPSVSAPSGAAASGSQGSAVSSQNQNPYSHLTGIFNSALDAAKTLGELDLQKSQAGLIKAQTYKTGVEGKVAEKDIPKSDIINKGYRWVEKVFDGLGKKFKEMQNVNSARDRDMKRTIKLRAN